MIITFVVKLENICIKHKKCPSSLKASRGHPSLLNKKGYSIYWVAVPLRSPFVVSRRGAKGGDVRK